MRRYDLHQANARRKTFNLIFGMSVTQLLTTLLIGLVFGYLVAVGWELNNWGKLDLLADEATTTFFQIMFTTTAIVTVIAGLWIAIAAWWKFHELKDGGRKIAEMLHASQIPAHTSDAQERQLLNIVEELAISSGITVPPVYIMRGEPGINALAAGHDPTDAAIVVTDGACKRLSRDQMQGVIAHEFAHILNGDMGRNLKLVALTQGNFSLLLAAQDMINANADVASKEALGTVTLVWIAGLVLWPLGLFAATTALVFVALIKRQGEYNADATAVEFTRLPNGLSDALRIIGGNETKSQVKQTSAMAVSHLFFADNGWSLTQWFDSHPPLDSRIQRLTPDWEGHYLFADDDDIGEYNETYEGLTELVGIAKTSARQQKKQVRKDQLTGTLNQVATAAMMTAAAADEVANSGEDELEEDVPDWICREPAFEVDINPTFVELAKEPNGAALILAAIRVDQFKDDRSNQLAQSIEPMIRGQFDQVRSMVKGLDESQRMVLFDTALESLRMLSGPPRTMFRQFAERASVPVESETCIERWAWQWLVKWKLSGPHKKPDARFGKLSDLVPETVILLSSLIHTDCDSQSSAQYTYIRSATHTGLDNTQVLTSKDCTLAALEYALNRLKYVAARQKRKLVVACGACATSNRDISNEEAWIIRAICTGLHCPMPKMIPGQPVTPGT